MATFTIWDFAWTRPYSKDKAKRHTVEAEDRDLAIHAYYWGDESNEPERCVFVGYSDEVPPVDYYNIIFRGEFEDDYKGK